MNKTESWLAMVVSRMICIYTTDGQSEQSHAKAANMISPSPRRLTTSSLVDVEFDHDKTRLPSEWGENASGPDDIPKRMFRLVPCGADDDTENVSIRGERKEYVMPVDILKM